MCPPVRRADTQVGPYTCTTIDKRPRRPRAKSIAFPAISTSGLGYPRADAVAVSSRTIEEFLAVDK
jgi:O-acetyl-ADP-ribose deacetylase (regulator of RNase III)